MTQEEKQAPDAAAAITPPPVQSAEPARAADKASQSRQSGRGGIVLGSIAILLTLGASGWMYLHGHQQASLQRSEMTEMNTRLAEALAQVNNLQKAQQQSQGEWSKGQQSLQDEMKNLQGRVLDLNEKRPNDWMLAEAEYLVRMAGRKLWLEHDLVSAITLLSNADERVAALNDPSLMEVRKAMAEDIAKLKTLPTLDREGLTLKIAALSDQVDQLPMNAVSMPEAEKQPDQTVSETVDDWQSNLKKNWVHFTENFITIRRRDGAVEALLSPQQEIYLRENLKTKLLQAQLAVYREQQELYADSLDKAKTWTQQYFDQDDSATRYVLSEIDKLKGEQVKFDYPDRFQTQALLERVLNDRLQRLSAGH